MPIDHETGLGLIRAIGGADRWLAVLVTTRAGLGSTAARNGMEPSVSVVNAGVLAHPTTGESIVAFVARGRTAKLTNLRADPRATLVFRAGWEWVSVRGPAELAGPDDTGLGLDSEALRLLLRDIYAAAGGNHDDLDTYDKAMAADHRTAVLIRPDRFTTNPTGTEHQEHG